ncbi:MAG: DUF1538 domain-containing protein [Wenzhouxiangellaceae bacterium]|nr:DUF1538 domain-containing protein [Wenzhouxiangellaceae bacterium]
MIDLSDMVDVFVATLRDVFPIAALIFGFQLFVLRRRPPHLARLMLGFVFVIVGLALFLLGLEQALFPLGKLMAEQLTDPDFIALGKTFGATGPGWIDYLWVYIFALSIGFATTIAEPALIAVSIKAHEVSAGAVSVWGLRVAVAIGVAVGIALGSFRIITGTPLQYYIIAGYILVIVQTMFAPRNIVALAYDSGGVTTSTVTVPLVTALGLGLASNVPGRSPIMDGFGLIAFASLFPIMAVTGYAQIGHYLRARQKPESKGE